MADEFQAGVCGSGNWWNNSSRSIFGLSPCASSINDLHFAWPSSHDSIDMKITSNNNKCSDHDQSGTSDDSVVLQELPKHHQLHDSVINTNNNNNTASLSSMDSSTLEMLGIGLSSSSSSTTPDWNHTFLHGNERSDTSYNPTMLQEDLNSSLNNYHQETGVDCSEVLGLNNFSTITQDSSTNSFKPMINQDFTLGQHQITSSTTMNSSTSSSSFSYPSSALLQTLFDNDPPQQQQQQQSSFINNQPMNFPPSSAQYRPNLNDFSPSFPKFPAFLKPKQTHASNHSSFSNAATSLWNTSASTSLLPSKHYQFMMPTFNEKSSTLPNLTAKSNAEEIRESSSSSVLAKKNNNEPAFKRPRMETPSPLPTFKVRKEKLGDRITALQQLVSPFGKTDTASVLHEAIEYIRFLHDQVNVLSTPYMKNGSPPQRHQGNEQEVSKQDLRSRGLCLVPISSTFPVAAETSTDFWTPTFGGTFR